MTRQLDIRWGWLKGMYAYTVVVSGGFGLGILLVPELVRSVFGFPNQDPVVLGFAGSVSLSFCFLSILGFRSPLKFAPVLLLQLSYKAVWFIGVILPLWLSGRFPPHALLLSVIFATFVIGDLIAIPFPHVFAPEPEPPPGSTRFSGS